MVDLLKMHLLEMRAVIQPYFDKLAAIPTTEGIRDFLIGEEIKATPRSPYHCALAEYLNQGTGIEVALSHAHVYPPCDPERAGEVLFTNTPVMALFAHQFDHGRYPELEV